MSEKTGTPDFVEMVKTVLRESKIPVFQVIPRAKVGHYSLRVRKADGDCEDFDSILKRVDGLDTRGCTGRTANLNIHIVDLFIDPPDEGEAAESVSAENGAENLAAEEGTGATLMTDADLAEVKDGLAEMTDEELAKAKSELAGQRVNLGEYLAVAEDVPEADEDIAGWLTTDAETWPQTKTEWNHCMRALDAGDGSTAVTIHRDSTVTVQGVALVDIPFAELVGSTGSDEHIIAVVKPHAKLAFVKA